VTLNGQAVVGFAYNAVTVDGRFGLMASSGAASFDDATVKTSDRAFAAASGGALLAADGALVSGASDTVTQSQLDGVAELAIGHWTEALGSGDPRLASFGDMRITFADLAGDMLGYASGRTVQIDRDAAGHGWSLGGLDDSDARMDLVTVLTHELGHVIGFEHERSGFEVMDATLAPAAQTPLEQALAGIDLDRITDRDLLKLATLAARGDAGALLGLPGFDLDGGAARGGTNSSVDWHAQSGEGWGTGYSPFGAEKAAKGKAANVSDYLVKVSGGKEQRAGGGVFDSLGSALFGSKPGKSGGKR
jgi:hypothetical protein